jgi:hypothetical protein
MRIWSVYVPADEKRPYKGRGANRCPAIVGLEMCIGASEPEAQLSVPIDTFCSPKIARASASQDAPPEFKAFHVNLNCIPA